MDVGDRYVFLKVLNLFYTVIAESRTIECYKKAFTVSLFKPSLIQHFNESIIANESYLFLLTM